jgi:putative FmdB family regulatory protein
MPIFEYFCDKCRFKFESIVFSEKEDKIILCRLCGDIPRKLVSVPSNPVFTGSGTYFTDYPSIDKVVGADAEKRWTAYAEQRTQREKQGFQYSKVSHNMVVKGESETSSFPVTRESYKQVGDKFPAITASSKDEK